MSNNIPFFFTKCSANSIIRNPENGKPYTDNLGNYMTVEHHGQLFFKVNKLNDAENQGHLYYTNFMDYCNHNQVNVNEEILYKWNMKVAKREKDNEDKQINNAKTEIYTHNFQWIK